MTDKLMYFSLLSAAASVLMAISFGFFLYAEIRKYLAHRREVKHRKFTVTFIDKKDGDPFTVVMITPTEPVTQEVAQQIYKIYDEFTKDVARKIKINEYRKTNA